MATNKLEGESCQNWQLTNWRGKLPKLTTNWRGKVAKIGKMLPDTKLPKMVMCVENPYQCFQRVYKYSCHLRAFRATADVANNGKSVIASKVAIFGNF